MNKANLSNLKVFSSTKGMSLANNGELISKHGLVLTSIKYTLPTASIIS